MIVVADTSPLNYLIRLGLPEVLHVTYGRVVVPIAVMTEMLHPDAPDEVRAFAASPPTWLEPVRASRIDRTLPTELGAGEREAISLALELRADLLLIDERAGRQEAESRNIEVAGTLAILLKASLLGLAEFPETIQRLRGMGFRVSRQVEAIMLARYVEAKKTIP